MAQVKIEKLDNLGRGIGYYQGKIVFVPKTIVSELVDVKIVKETKKVQEAVLKAVLIPSEKRVKSKCPYYDNCEGCAFLHISYDESVSWKSQILSELFQRNDLWQDEISVISSSNPWYYRNKVSLKVLDGKLTYTSFDGKKNIFISECKIVSKAINAVLADFSLFSFSNGELVIRANENDEILMDIITEDRVQISKEFTLRHKIAGILINHKCVYGSSSFFERKNGVLYQVSMRAFFQVNPYMSSRLFSYIRDILVDAKSVLDLYCGVGTLGLQLAKDKKITGIEVVKEAVLNAVLNARLNHFTNCSFYLGKVEDVISHLVDTYEVFLVDPPRSGLDDKTKKVILEYLPEMVVYVSCNPLTLVRDLKYLKEKYLIKSILGFDMFPFTKHVECVCVLNRQ